MTPASSHPPQRVPGKRESQKEAIKTMRGLIILLIVASAAAFGECGTPRIVNPFVCRPGSTFKLDCNHCHCDPRGGDVGACTRMLCPLRWGECIPGSYFRIQGKLCPCPGNGYKWHSACFG